jgi:hypothetical protein
MGPNALPKTLVVNVYVMIDSTMDEGEVNFLRLEEDEEYDGKHLLRQRW